MPLRVRLQVLMGFVKSLVTLPWWEFRSRRQRAMLDENADHVVVVEPGPGGRPGERLIARTPSLWKTRMVPGSRNDFQVYLDRAGSHLTAICLGRVTERGEPERSARQTLELFWKKRYVSFDPIVVDRIGGEQAYRYRLALGRTDVIEWKFAHDGWLYVVGAFNRCDDEVATFERARKVLDTWEWLH
jgi:hypothetical protein